MIGLFHTVCVTLAVIVLLRGVRGFWDLFGRRD